MRGGRAPGPVPGRGPMPGGAQQMGAQAEGKSTGRSWHWMLPFYTVGVIVFLLYTLSKVCQTVGQSVKLTVSLSVSQLD